ASLCKNAILFKAGQASEKLPVDEGVRRYLEQTSGDDALPLEKKSRIQLRDRSPIFHHLSIRHDGRETTILPTASEIEFEIGLQNFSDEPGALTCGVALTNERGQRVALFHTLYHSDMTFKGSDNLTLRCKVPSLPLTPGRYNVELVIANGFDIIEKVERAAVLDVVFADVLGTGKLPMYHQSVLVLPAEWKQV
ncbi:MAG TPA: Wzt carbohydrate-binding domain-containing protein, partial [Tepidisphaeraceae bacterium]|nr:Wzt carbohydrate-binding domain-containing protein [Tepidisphaeraceae bacterium]